MADSTYRSLTINGIVYEGCHNNTDGNDYYCYFDSSTDSITKFSDLQSNWYTADRQIKIIIDDSYSGKMVWYGDSSGNKEVTIDSIYYGEHWLAYHQPGAAAPFALCSGKKNSDEFDRGWVTQEFFEHFAPKGKFILNFNANGGSVSEISREVIAGNQYGNLPIPTRFNYKFLGWYTALTEGTKITSTSVVEYSVQTLYAHWEKYSGTAWIYLDGKWNKAIPYIFKNGEWKRITPYIFKNGKWNKCI